MTVPTLIYKVLKQVQDAFYAGRVPVFHRHKRDLTKAIARYGYVCLQRGWEPDAQAIYTVLSELLSRIERHKADVQYLPVYLESAVTGYLNQHAEEMNSTKKRIEIAVNKLAQLPNTVRNPTPVEILATLYSEKAHRIKATRMPASSKQMPLL